MPLSKKRLVKELVRAAFEFHALRPWENFLNEDVIPLRIPGQEHPAFASILGAAGEEFGLSVFLGERAAAKLLAEFGADMPTEDTFHEDQFVAFTMAPLGEIVPWARNLLELGGHRGRRESPAPWLMAKQPGRNPHRPNRDELETLLFAVCGVLRIIEAGLAEPSNLEPGEGRTIFSLSGDARSPEVVREAFDVPVPDAGPDPQVAIPDGVAELPRLDVAWHVGYPVLPIGVQGDDRTVRAVLVYSPDEELIMGLRNTMDSEEAGRAFYEILVAPAEDAEPHLPREVRFRHASLFRILAPGLAALGVGAVVDRDLPGLDEVMDDLCGAVAGGDHRLPEPDDLAAWKEADRRIPDRAIRWLGRNRIQAGRAMARYFGAEKAGRKLFDGPLGEGAAPAYVDWLMWDYRSEPLAPTYSRRLLESGQLLPAERVLFRSRMSARLSIYRVDGFGEDGRVALVDIFDGSRFVIRDYSLAEDESALDTCVPIRVFPAGAFHFASIAGPPLVRDSVDEGLDLLESQVSPLTAEALSRKPEALGKLWIWYERLLRKPPVKCRFVNSSGHLLSLREATCEVENLKAVAETLLEDDEFDGDGEDLVWVRDLGDKAPMGSGLVITGRIRAEQNRIVAETNSLERMEELLARLEAIPGVGPGTVEDVSPPELRRPPAPGAGAKEVLVDSCLEGAESQEEAERLMIERTREHYLAWVDIELPALGGRTPREAAATPEGGRRVRRMILSMPRPPAEPGVDLDLPREEMLRSLGLLDLPTREAD